MKHVLLRNHRIFVETDPVLRPKQIDDEDLKHRRHFDTLHRKCGLRQPQKVQPPKQPLLPFENDDKKRRRKDYILKGWTLD